MIALLLALGAHAADTPSLWARQMVGGGAWPSGLITDTRVQVRAPLYRSSSIVFRDTYAGAGARAAASPAFVEVGPRVSFAPIDVFDVDVQGTAHAFLDNQYGLLPMSGTTGTLEVDRDARADETFAARAVSLTVAPTLKVAVGPFVAFDAWTVQAFRLTDPPAAALVYHPFWDLVIAPSDVIVEHQAAALWRALPGDDGALLWLGPTWRDRFARGSGDRSATLGAFVRARPASPERRAVPNLVLAVLPYVIDGDHLGGAPNVQVAAVWAIDTPLRPDAAAR